MARRRVELILSLAEATALRAVARGVMERPNLMRMLLSHHREQDAAHRAVQVLDASIKGAHFGKEEGNVDS